LSAENPRREFGQSLIRKKPAVVILLGIILLLAAACSGQGSETSSNDSETRETSKIQQEATGGASPEQSVLEESTVEKAGPSGEEVQLARAEVGKNEISNMMPAGGEKPDAARPLPEDPPIGIEVNPATTNRTVEGPIDYERRPPTNGDHDPLWQNCGFYEEPIKDRHAVHSMDHGVVWITYRPDLPERQIKSLRPYGNENYVLVSPYPGQNAPVIATSWRVQLELNGAADPRLGRFVEQFRISELAPLSGNRCTSGVGNPEG
jgi:hypothetical protein